jgi:hypothetical protein
MGKCIEQTVLKRSTNGQGIHEQMFNVPHHKGNASQKDIETLRFHPPLSQCCHQEHKQQQENTGIKEALCTVGGNVN